MAKTKISEFSSTPANNTDIDSINIAEGCAPSGINDAIRELMAQLKDFQTGAQGDSFNGPIGTSTAAAGAFTTLSATGAITSTLATGTAPLVIASTTKVANLNVDLLDGADWASPAALGSTTPAAVSATTLSASSTVTLSGGTANGIPYLNASKVLTTGSALAFDGSNVTANGSFTSGTTGVAGSFILARSSDGAGTTVLESLAATNNIGLRNTVGSIIFSANNSEGMRLTSTGLGIGTSSPSAKLHVSGVGRFARSTDASQYLNLTLETGNATYNAVGSINHVWQNAGTEQMRLDTSGNLGLGVTPSAWSSSSARAIQIGDNNGSISSFTTGETGSNFLFLNNNAYYSTTWKYIQASIATAQYAIANGEHRFLNASGGSADATITFTQAMTLDASGNLGIGTSSPSYKLDVRGSSGNIASWSDGTTTGTLYAGGGYVGLTFPAATGGFFVNPSGNFNTISTNGVERMRIDSSGNLGLGVTPSAWSGLKVLQFGGGVHLGNYTGSNNAFFGANSYFNGTNWIYQNTAFAVRYQANGFDGTHTWYNAPSGTAGNAITFTQAMTLTAGGKLLVGFTTAPTADASLFGNGIQSTLTSGGGGFANLPLSGGGQAFYTHTGTAGSESYSERARIDSSGNFMVGKTSSSANGDGAQLFPSGTVGLGHTSGTVTGTAYAAFGYAGGGIGSITQSGTTAVLYNTTSDQRLKENIADAESASSLIDALQVRKFDWKADGSHQRYGFVAQELVTVAPEAVHQPEDSEEMMAVDYSKLVPMLVKEIQSLRKRLADAGL